MTLPGTKLLRLSRRWLGRDRSALTFEPLVADWQREYLDAGSTLAQARIWCRGAGAATVALVATAGHTLVTSRRVRPVLRSIAAGLLVFSVDAIRDARHLPWSSAIVSIGVSLLSWLPVIVSGALWLSRRYARLWQVSAVVTVTCALSALALSRVVQPAIDATPLAHTSEAARWMSVLGPSIFALLSGTAALAHMRSGRRRERVFSPAYVFAGTVVCVAFLIVVGTLRRQGIERSQALGLATMAVLLPTTLLFVVIAESERRLFVRYRGRRAHPAE